MPLEFSFHSLEESRGMFKDPFWTLKTSSPSALAIGNLHLKTWPHSTGLRSKSSTFHLRKCNIVLRWLPTVLSTILISFARHYTIMLTAYLSCPWGLDSLLMSHNSSWIIFLWAWDSLWWWPLPLLFSPVLMLPSPNTYIEKRILPLSTINQWLSQTYLLYSL